MFEPEELMARIVDLEEQLKVSEMAPPAAEQLIACLEGEIAKRDEELAACRVAVENCEVFRARIVELEDLVPSLQCKAIESDDLRAELAAIKAQEPVAWAGVIEDCASLFVTEPKLWKAIPLYAAPASEAKAQDVVLQELLSFEKWWCSTPILRESKRTIAEKAWRAARIAAAPAAPVSAQAEAKAQDFDPLVCDYCNAETQDPWHGSGMLNGVESRHIHACSQCRNLLPTAKAQGVVMPPSPYMPGSQPTDFTDYELGEIHGRIAMWEEVKRLNAAPAQQVSVPDGPAKMQWPEIVALVNEVLGCEAHKYPCERGSIGHEMTGINFNSLARIIDRVHRLAAAPAAPSQGEQVRVVPVEPAEAMRKAAQDKLASEGLIVTDWLIHTAYSAMLAAAPAAPAADADLVEALDYQVLFDAIAAATSVYANGAVNISVQAFRDALAAHRAKGVV